MASSTSSRVPGRLSGEPPCLFGRSASDRGFRRRIEHSPPHIDGQRVGSLSLITPPNCLATFTAAAIAHAEFWKTGWTGMRLGIAAYVVPFVFALHPALILKGTPGEIA